MWVTETESEWDEQEQAYMLALAVHRSRLCPRCHTDLRETAHPDNEGRYRPALPTRCHKCDGLILSQEGYTRDQGTPRPEALLHNVDFRPGG